MKKIFLIALCCLLSSAMSAQKVKKTVHDPKLRDAREASVTVAALGREQFVLYVDGQPFSSRSGNKFSVFDLAPNQVHSIAVVLSRPVNVLAYTEFYVSPNTHEEYFIRCNAAAKYAEIVDRNGNVNNYWNNGDWTEYRGFGRKPFPPQHNTRPVPPPVPQYCSDADVADLVVKLKRESFDDSRLKLAKTAMVSSLPYTTEQIRSVARLFSFDSGRMDYLKFAYSHCYDVQNYYKLTDLFTFSSDRDKLLDFIQRH